MININSDLKGLGDYIGTIGGILQAVEDPRFKGDFTENMMDTVTNAFMIETIAANRSGKDNIAHVFEWGSKQGEITDIPLFKVTRSGNGGRQHLGYMFLPSVRYVPLVDPMRYGINPEILKEQSRHVFQLKAIIMETKNRVAISPRGPSGKLFIPYEKAKKGFVMTTKTVMVNPGGPNATGGFATWWTGWFASRAQAVVNTEVKQAEAWLVATNAKYVRYAAGTSIGGTKVGGRFASGRAVSISYVNAKEATVKQQVLKEAKMFFDKEAYESTWSE